MRYRALVAYDGTDFLGWQSQNGQGRTVQETLSSALSTVLRQPVTVVGAGRTDSGVHANGQVIAFDAEGEIDLARAERSANAVLPDDVAVREIAPAAPDFDPRRHAVRRAYRYRIWNAPTPSPLERRTSWHVDRPLDLEAMAAAAGALVGEHDFASFQAADKMPRPSVRRVEKSEFAREGEIVTYWIEANAFARHMVRNLVGQLVRIGLGRAPASSVDSLLAARDRSLAAPPAPPQGLFLEWVRYR